jgi:methionine-S-sulfoxide reductase
MRVLVSVLFGVLWLVALPASAERQEAIFAGGCFWCTEADFERVPGVLSAQSGYLGGHLDNPDYRQVSSGGTGHIEAVKVEFDSQVVDYETLLRVYWRSIDPLTENRQFCDSGEQYSSAIFYLNDSQRLAAQHSRDALAASGVLPSAIKTRVLPASYFWLAEDYHQDYYKKNSLRYKYYRFACGRDSRLQEIWGREAGWVPDKVSSQPDASPTQ